MWPASASVWTRLTARASLDAPLTSAEVEVEMDQFIQRVNTSGLRDVLEWDVDVELVTQSGEQHWEMISEHVSLAVAALQRVDEPARGRIRANAIAKVSAFETDGKVRVPGVARCIVGTKLGASGPRPVFGARSSDATRP